MEEMPESDVTVKLDLPIFEDVPANLDQFVILSSQGHFIEAEQLYQSHLEPHEAWFSVVIEYTLHLLRIYDLPKLRDYLKRITEHNEVYSSKENLFLQDVARLMPRSLEPHRALKFQKVDNSFVEDGILKIIALLLSDSPDNIDVSTLLEQLYYIHN